MKKLKKNFKSRGFFHEQVTRVGNRAIYKRHPVKVDHVSANHYEVVKIGSHNGYKLGASYIDATETYPSSSMWGTCGWTCDSLETAQDKFDELGKYTT
jgi:hypothetical protein